MNLHEYPDTFKDLQEIVAEHIGIPAGAVKRDYYIVKMLQKLAESPYSNNCVFKGGTSLSKCYPGSIARFSEDIDLTFIPSKELGNKQYDKILKQIEKTVGAGFRIEKIDGERNDRNKSAYIWFDDFDMNNGKIKLEIGSSVRPDPYYPMSIRTYIQEYLESKGYINAVTEYDLQIVTVNTLAIERTFIDKAMSVKRHAICGSLLNKVRHIYDVTALFTREDIQKFLRNSQELKRLLKLTKETDEFYVNKRNISKEYNPLGAYDFFSWRTCFDDKVKHRYESLHKDLLYTNEQQDFNRAIDTFEKLNQIFINIGE